MVREYSSKQYANDAINKSDDGVMLRGWSGVDSDGITWYGEIIN